MGHNLYGYKPSNLKKEVAKLRRGSMDRRNPIIYKALKSEQFYATDSGTGDLKIFTDKEIRGAIKYIGKTEGLEPERDFLNDCLSNVDEAREIAISFE